MCVLTLAGASAPVPLYQAEADSLRRFRTGQEQGKNAKDAKGASCAQHCDAVHTLRDGWY